MNTGGKSSLTGKINFSIKRGKESKFAPWYIKVLRKIKRKINGDSNA